MGHWVEDRAIVQHLDAQSDAATETGHVGGQVVHMHSEGRKKFSVDAGALLILF
jgi:hypothetical protein